MKKVLLSLIFLVLSHSYYAQLTVSSASTAAALANYLLGGGVTISNAVLTCKAGAAGSFSNGGTTNLGINSGVVLSTGLISSIPNTNGVNASTNNNTPGFAAMAPLTGTSSNFDGCLLEFDIVPHCSPLNIKYKFASEEYPEYVGLGFNDGFGFFIDGPNPLGGNYVNYNLATVPGSSTPITIDNVNSVSNSAYYIANTGSTIVFDGMTTVLTGSANVTPCAQYHLSLAITDGGDRIYDSGVFLQQSGISCVGPTVTASSSASGGGGGVICAGQSATLSASGASTYSWSTGATSSSIVVSPTTTTTYSLGGSNIGVCIQSNIVMTVTVNPAPTAVAGPAKVLTCAQTTTLLAGSGGGTYAWSGPGIVSGGTTASPTVNQAGTYSLIVTSSSSPFCPSVVSTVAVTANTTAPTPAASSSGTLTCATTTVSLTGTGGGTYNWSGTGIVSGGATANPVVNGTGPYVVTVTAANGCTATANTSVAQNNTPPTPNATNSGTLTCATTTVSLTGTGGGTYSWSGTGIISGGATANPVVNGTGPYVVTVTAANGCTATANTSVAQNITPPTPTASNSTTLTCATTTAALTGTGGGTYSWSGTGIVSGGTTANPVVNGTGPYVVTVTAANGCTATANTTVVQNTTPPTPGASNSGSISCTATTSTLTGTGGGTYSWSGPSIVSGGATANPVVNAGGNYNVTVTAANGCTAVATTSVTQSATLPTPTASNSGTLTCSTTTVVLTGTGGGTYSWSGTGIVSGGATANPVVNGTGPYVLTVTAANGCTATANTSVAQNTTAPTPNASTSGTLTCATSTVSLTGTGGGTYSWSGTGIVSGGATANPVVNGTGPYVLTVTAANGCTATANTSVAQNTTAPTPNASNTGTLTCATSTVSLTGTGGGTYSWSGTGIVSGGATANPVVNGTGPYVLTVTAANGCTATANTSVAQNTTAPTPNASTSGTLTCATSTVSLTGTGGGTYSWSGTGIVSGGATANPVVNGTGPYVLTVTAANGCTATANTSVAQNTAIPLVTSAATGSLDCNITSVDASATSTSTPVSYNWTGVGITAGTGTGTISVNQGGSYNYTVTNTANGCIATGSQAITQNTTTPAVTAAASGVLNCTLTSIDASATTSTTPVSYNWTGAGITAGAGTGTVSVNQPGTYNYTVTNTSNGCMTTGSQAVTQNTTTPTANAGPTQTIVCGVASVTLTGSGTAGSTASWLGGVCGSPTSFTTTACAPGTYTLVATDAVSSCTNTSFVTVSSSTNVPQATVDAITNSITCTNSVVAIGVTYSGTDPVTYAWSGPGVTGSTTSAATSANLSGTYNVTITNTSSGCQSVYSAVVPTNTTPVSATTASSASLTCNTNTVNVSVTATPTGTNYAYSWTGPGTITNGTTDTPTVDAGGNYVVTVTDNTNGCVGTFTATVNSNTTIPSFTLGTAPSVTTTCAVPSATLSATSNVDPNSVYTWTTPSLGTVTGSPLVASAPGIYTVVVTNTVNGCSTSATSPATVELVADSGTPVVTLSSNTASITCSDPTPSVSITTTATPVTYSWSPTTGIVPGTETTANPVFNAAGTYSAVVTNTTSGCSTSTSGNVVTVTLDNTVPVITLSAGTNTGAINCINSQVVISPIVTPGVNLTYTWSPAGVISTAINNATFTASGVYTLAVTNTLTGCVSTSTSSAGTFTVTVDNTLPTASINVLSSNTSIGCGASNATVTLNGSNSTSANPSPVMGWLPGPVAGSSLPVTTAGTYTLVVVDAVNGCADSTQITVTGNTNPPQGVNAGGSANISCGSTSTILNGVTTTTNTSYSWAGPSGTSIISNGNTLFPTVGEVGDYTLTVTDNSTGCSDSSVVNVTQANATASITANPTTGISPLLVNFTGTGAGNPTYSWSFGDGNTSGAQNPGNTFTTGTYTVTLTTTSGSCTATATVEIVVEDGLTLEIPNVFTPNGDGANEFFSIKSTGVKEISLQVFNRWGQKLYEFSGPKASWDGLTPNGGHAPEGTYFYFVKATGFDGQEIEKHGSVNLFR